MSEFWPSVALNVFSIVKEDRWYFARNYGEVSSERTLLFPVLEAYTFPK